MPSDLRITGREGGSISSADAEFARGRTEEVLPLAEERLLVSKRVVETGRVRVAVTTETAEEVVRDVLRTRRAEVERVPIGREVTEVPQSRQEGDVLIVPVVEEILVVEKRLFLKEEIWLRFIDTEESVEQPVQRRVQRATVERVPPQRTDTPLAGVTEVAIQNPET